MKNHIAEDLPARKFAPAAAGSAPVDKRNKKDKSTMTSKERVSQAASDIRYKANLKGIPYLQEYEEYMKKSELSNQEKNMVKAKLLGKGGGGIRAEDFNPIFKNAASDNVAKALFKVFVEKKEINIEDLKEFYTRRNSRGDLVFHVRITDKKTGNSYTRDATRQKLDKLRANPNIDIEMSEYRKDSEIERTKGALTARVAAGIGLDPDGDGKVESDAKEYRGVVHNAIQRKKGGVADGKDTSSVREEFIHEAGRKKKSDKPEQLDIRKGICNAVTISPTQGGNEKVGILAHNELDGEIIAETGYSKFLKKVHSLQEKAVSQNQQQLAAMAIEYLDGNMPDASDAIKQMAKMGRKELKKFASTKHEGLPEKVKEEMDCGSDDKKKKNGVDNRSLPTKINIAKNIVRAATGIKNPMVMVASEQTGPALPGENRPGSPKAPGNRPHLPGENQTPLPNRPKLQRASYEPEGEVIDEAEQRIRQPRQSANPRGTYDSTGIGQYPRTGKERKKMRKGEPVEKYRSLEKTSDKSDYDDRDHPSLSARERNPRLR